MPRYNFKDGVPAVIEIWKVGCKKRGGPPQYVDEHGGPLGYDPRISKRPANPALSFGSNAVIVSTQI